MSSHIIASLAEASRRNRVYEVPEFGEPYQTGFGRDWHHPSFDFSRVLDNLDVDELAQVVEDFVQADIDGTINLPFPKCLYIFQHRCGDLDVLNLVQSTTGITAEVFIRLIAPDGGSQAWYRPPMNFSFDFSTGIFRTDRRISERHLLASDGTYDVVINRLYAIVAVGTVLLGRDVEREVQPGGQTLRESNLGREKGKLNPIPEIITIKLKKRRPAPSVCGPIDTSGVPRSPHNRRAHVRHLRSGKVIPVRASAIHGGGDPRHYQIFL